jgi:succinate dehydrogenase / fumarate reductase cytochrome b subunit
MLKNNGGANSSWFSRNMILSGSVILAFGTAFYDFWVPEMVYKYVEVNPLDSTRYFHELAEKFESPVRTAIYCVSFVFCPYTCCMVFLQCSQLVSIINIRKHYTN